MKPITFTDDDNAVTIGLSTSKCYLVLEDADDSFLIGIKALDKLINALQEFKKESDNVGN